MKKIALGVVAALLLAAFPIALAGPASAANLANVDIINGTNLGSPGFGPINVWIDGTSVITNLGQSSNGIVLQLGNGQHSIMVCKSSTTSLTAAGNCATAADQWIPMAGGPQLFYVIGGNSYDLIIGVVNNGGTGVGVTNLAPPGFYLGPLNLSPTPYGLVRMTFINTLLGPPAGAPPAPFTTGATIGVCLNGVKIVTGLLPGFQQEVQVPAGQQQLMAIQVPEAVDCPTTPSVVNLVAGTNFVLAIVPNSDPTCTAGCAQVLFVDQERHPNISDVSGFCSIVPGLATFAADYKATFGGINPTDTFSFPSIGVVRDFANRTTNYITEGDLFVTNDIKPQWEVISQGLRNLVQGLKLVNYDINAYPAQAREELAEGANGFKLPGVSTPDRDGAVTALFAWQKANCAPAATPAAPAAVPASAGPRFTG